jgi:uncharacterized membrane protein YphA (DoxX/SURF4 family)
MLDRIRRTEPIGHLIVVRALISIPLMAIAMLHLTGWFPIRVVLEAAHVPLVDVWAIVAPLAELAAAAMMFFGAWARIGAVIGGAVMLVAMYAHMVADWPEEPPMLVPMGIFFGCCYILARGAGAWSVDSRVRSNPLEVAVRA